MSKPYEISSRHRRIAGLMFLVALSLAVQSALHLSGAIHPTTGNTETRAGIAEAVICVVLLRGSSALAWRGPAGYRIALWTDVFAVAGFIIGLSVTIPSGYVPDIAYHATVLPILIITVALIVRYGHPSAGPGRHRDRVISRSDTRSLTADSSLRSQALSLG